MKHRFDIFEDYKEYNQCTISTLNTIVDLDTPYKDDFIKTFNSMYWFNNISYTVEQDFWDYIKRVYDSFADTFKKKIAKYNQELDETKGYYRNESVEEYASNEFENEGSSNREHIDLPNRQTTNNYVSDKDNSTSGNSGSASGNKTTTLTRAGGVNIIDQRERMLKYYHNIFIEMCEKFSNAFLKIYL